MHSPDSEGAIFSNEFQNSNELKPQGIAASPSSHIFLFPINGFANIRCQFLHQISVHKNKIQIGSSQKKKKNRFIVSCRIILTHLRASALTLPIACTTASQTSTASHLNSGTVSLYKAAGLALLPGDLLSALSADRLSGDELDKFYNKNILYILKKKIVWSCTTNHHLSLTFCVVHALNKHNTLAYILTYFYSIFMYLYYEAILIVSF